MHNIQATIFNNKVYGKCYRVYKENIDLISNDEVVDVIVSFR